MKGIFAEHLEISARVLDMRLERQNVVMSNIANLKTPGYRARRVEFENQLQEALRQTGRGKMSATDPGHLPVKFDKDGFGAGLVKEVRPRIIQGEDAVNMEQEVTVMAKNTMMYNALITALKHELTELKTVIQEGAR